jgi:hypothetical protein
MAFLVDITPNLNLHLKYKHTLKLGGWIDRLRA